MDFESLYKEIVNISGSESGYHAKIKKRLIYIWGKTSDLISSDSTVVEIGIGPMAAIAKQLKGAKVIGVDHTEEQAVLCDKFGIEIRRCDLQTEPLPLEDASVDVVFLMEVIEHLCAYPNDVFDEIYKKLKPGGYLVVSTVNFLRISNRVRMLLGKTPLASYFERSQDGHNHLREFHPDEMAYYMKKSNLSIEKTYRFGFPFGPTVVSMLLRLAYLYPKFQNYFMVIGKK